MHFSISPDLEQLIAQQAQALGFESPEAFLRHLVESGQRACAPKELTDAEFFRLLAELASEPNLPGLPADFSRADLYSDHD